MQCIHLMGPVVLYTMQWVRVAVFHTASEHLVAFPHALTNAIWTVIYCSCDCQESGLSTEINTWSSLRLHVWMKHLNHWLCSNMSGLDELYFSFTQNSNFMCNFELGSISYLQPFLPLLGATLRWKMWPWAVEGLVFNPGCCRMGHSRHVERKWSRKLG